MGEKKIKGEEKRQIVALAAVCGPLSIIIMILCISIPLMTSTWFSWTGNALSDLGIYSEYGWVFSYGMIASGILLLFFSIGLLNYLEGHSKTAAYGFCLGSIGLMGVGFFPEGILQIL